MALDTSSLLRQSACWACRKFKTKCERKEDVHDCDRCSQKGIECIVPPAYSIGRQRGSKNKRSGLQKALSNIDQVVAHGSLSAQKRSQLEFHAKELQNLLSECSGASLGREGALAEDEVDEAVDDPLAKSTAPLIDGGTLDENLNTLGTGRKRKYYQETGGEDVLVEGLSNPLQLLSDTSGLFRPLFTSRGAMPGKDEDTMPRSTAAYIDQAFGRYPSKLDLGGDRDPIDMGLVDMTEAEALFSFFFNRIAQTRRGLDHALHTVQFVRSRSAFLSTSILTAAVLFYPGNATLARRLAIHSQKLAQGVILSNFRSVEIVLGFTISVAWLSPGENGASDNTCSYIGAASIMALDLSLDKSTGIHSRDGTNYKGVTKKMTITAIFYALYCTGNVAGTQMFRSAEAPLYPTAMKAIMSCDARIIVLCLMFRFYLQWTNAKRRGEEGIEGSADASGAVAGGKVMDVGSTSAQVEHALHQVDLQPEDYEDVSDWKTLGFRYRY
ncbi:hypothetical protein GQ53DRAFT_838005 [Thozetella sp. PMI_491]|nr:hypothetical protein GQ53DRAFT_838005 [Thozetella sp. PMI_491]